MIGRTTGAPVSITGLGVHVPERVLTNEELATMVDTSDEWIRTRTGIRERRVARPDEAMTDAVARRASFELGIALGPLEPMLPDFRYRAVDASGIVENEVCPVFSAVTTDAVAANPSEVAEWRWIAPESLRAAAAAAPYAFSPWLVLQLASLG